MTTAVRRRLPPLLGSRTHSRRPLAAVGTLLVLSAAAAALDQALPPYAARDLLFLVPVGLVAWWFGRAWGAYYGFLAALLRVTLAGGGTSTLALAWTLASAFLEYAAAALVIAALRAAHDRERHAARHDELTGLLNRRAFYAACSPWCHDAATGVGYATAAVAQRITRWRLSRFRDAFPTRRRGRRPTLAGESGVALAYLDLDGFKRVNDTLGHAAGDAVLRAVSAALGRATRGTDVTARLGGDEFAVLLPGANLAGADTAASRILDELRAAMRAEGWPVDASLGVAVFPSPPSTVDALVRAADALMYAVKQGGKGRAAVHVVPGARTAA